MEPISKFTIMTHFSDNKSSENRMDEYNSLDQKFYELKRLVGEDFAETFRKSVRDFCSSRKDTIDVLITGFTYNSIILRIKTFNKKNGVIDYENHCIEHVK